MMLMPRGISLRLFFMILVLMVLLSWQLIVRGSEYIATEVQQAVEASLVDVSNILAASVAQQSKHSNTIDTSQLDDLIFQLQRRADNPLNDDQNNQTYLTVYVTDAGGIVVYDSEDSAVGLDYSNKTEIALALLGHDGRRYDVVVESTYSRHSETKQTVIAVPIMVSSRIIGALSLNLTQGAYDLWQAKNWGALRWLVLGYLASVLLVVFVMAWWLALALRRITRYAEAMAANRPAQQPRFGDVYLRRLTESLTHLRQELDGKQTVEYYVHGLTHELKTPLTSIRAATEFLSEADLSTDEHERFVRQIRHSSQRMHLLIERLLQLARLENRVQIGKPEEIKLCALIRHIIQDSAPLLQRKRLKIDSQGIAALHFFGDRTLVEQALSNLLENAIDFADSDSTITLHTKMVGKWIEIRVCNQGPIIPDYALPKLTERFFSLPRPGGLPRSSGLGLSFVAQIMTLHGGELHVYNTGSGVCAVLQFIKSM